MQAFLSTYFLEYVKTHDTEHIYGLFDGVKYPMLWSDLEDGVLVYDILFREEALQEALEQVAPYLVKLDFSSKESTAQSKALLGAYGNNACIFFASTVDILSVLEKMREMFYVYNDNNEVGYFRFYSPTVFSEFLTQTEGNALFNLFYEIEKYWYEDMEDEDVLLCARLENERVNYSSTRIHNET